MQGRSIHTPEGGAVAPSRIAGAAAIAIVIPFLGVLPASAAVAAPAAPAASSKSQPSDIRELTRKDFKLDGKKVETPTYQKRAQTKSRTMAATGETPPVGTVRQWLGLDDYNGTLYRKDYTLRGVGNKIEVWVANDVAFPAGDCRLQDPTSTLVTDAQVANL